MQFGWIEREEKRDRKWQGESESEMYVCVSLLVQVQTRYLHPAQNYIFNKTFWDFN